MRERDKRRVLRPIKDPIQPCPCGQQTLSMELTWEGHRVACLKCGMRGRPEQSPTAARLAWDLERMGVELDREGCDNEAK